MKEVKNAMCAPFHGVTPECGCHDACCFGTMTLEEEVKALGIHRQHLQLQVELIERRIASLKKVG
ncbi:MAG TPA: hypothetical protein VEI51_02550 [Methanomicrobiales archaeon]|nr:hypothetical protein [Methanomicrobiales archaeon]